MLLVFLLCLVSIVSHLIDNGLTAEVGPNPRGIVPLVINTWHYPKAARNGYDVLEKGGSALDAIEKGCSTCEDYNACDHTVGWGGNPNSAGETTLDALIMDGTTVNVGAVAGLRRVRNAISVARAVLDHTHHTVLVGDMATDFAIQMGFQEYNLTSDWSEKIHKKWKANKCQPNYWFNVVPDPMENCGPYKPIKRDLNQQIVRHSASHDSANSIMSFQANYDNHDTIGMVAIDRNGSIAVGTSTNGLRHKIPGRVGDSPLPGAGAYVDQDYGGAAATGNGDIIARFVTSYQAVENLRQGMDVKTAANEAISRIAKKFPNAMAAIVVVDTAGRYATACINIPGGFPYAVINPDIGKVAELRADCYKI